MKAVLLYTAAPDAIEKAPLHGPAHHAHAQPYQERGELLMIGPFADMPAEGAMAIFTTRDAAESFAAEDPFVTEGVVASHRVLDWNA